MIATVPLAFPRKVVPELLDGMDVHDAAAKRSRRDLQRIHRAMGTRATVLRALRELPGLHARKSPLRLLELGAGDGSLMLGVARALQGQWPAVELTLLDRQDLLLPSAVAHYAAAGWSVKTQVADALDWAADAGAVPHWDVIVANLFLHHFEGPQLALLLAAVEARTDYFFACEPRRAWLALAGSHLVGAIGANAVTRVDAVLSVHAGFRGKELQALWPAQNAGWTLAEHSAGLFSHCLVAARAERKRTNAR